MQEYKKFYRIDKGSDEFYKKLQVFKKKRSKYFNFIFYFFPNFFFIGSFGSFKGRRGIL